MTLRAPRFDWSFNFGHILQLFGMMITVGGGLWWTSAKFENIDIRIAAAEARATVWTPRVEGLLKSQDIQDERIGNLTDAVKGVRQEISESNRAVRVDMAETTKSVSNLRESMASVNAKLDNLLKR